MAVLFGAHVYLNSSIFNKFRRHRMKQFVLTITFVLVVISPFICSVFVNKFELGQQVKDGKFDIVYEYAFSNTVELDSD